MDSNNKIFAERRAIVLSFVAGAAAIGANILLFCILAMAKTAPSPAYTQEYESIRIVTLDLPEPSTAESIQRDAVTDIFRLTTEPTNTESPRSAVDMASTTIPHLAERLSDAMFQLPGVSINPPSVSLLRPAKVVTVGSMQKPASMSEVDRSPSKIKGAPPRYPLWARRGKLKAVVTLRFIVTAKGTVEDIHIHEIEGDERFGREAIQAVSQWRFNPAIKAGKSIPCWCFQKISFKFTY